MRYALPGANGLTEFCSSPITSEGEGHQAVTDYGFRTGVKGELFIPTNVIDLWNLLAAGSDGFRRRLNTFIKDRSISG